MSTISSNMTPETIHEMLLPFSLFLERSVSPSVGANVIAAIGQRLSPPYISISRKVRHDAASQSNGPPLVDVSPRRL